ncbi:MAG: hypothetical protein QOH89_1284, partial [Pseudonocardiales bacterium]|nr:hypothetical protein [Pseudonocardiales bacterium]
PVCHLVFENINKDESRHIAVDFSVLDELGHAKLRKLFIDLVGRNASPGLILGAVMYIPLLNRMRNNIVEMGLDPARFYSALNRFTKLGERSEAAARVPLYKVVKWHAGMVINQKHPYHLLANSMVWASERVPARMLPGLPTWFREITYEPVSVGTAGRNVA